VPEIAAPVKVQAIRARGATVHQGGADYAAALAASEALTGEDGVLVVHAYDAPHTLAGQGTVARELSEQAPDVDVVVVAVGGGGLIGGIAAWYAGDSRVIGVEPQRCPTLTSALKAGEPVDVEVGGVAADALGAARVGTIGFGIATRFVQQVVTVSDEDIMRARRLLWNECRIAVEPGAAATLAAVLTNAYPPLPDERVCLVLCGANADPSDLGDDAS
jgi:threonine dehydratase